MPETTKAISISVRLTPTTYFQFVSKCAKQDLTMSQVLRKYIKTEINDDNTN